MKLREKVTQQWWRGYEKVVYDWNVPLRFDVIKRALDPKLTELQLEILSNEEYIDRNHRIEKQNGRAYAFEEIARLTERRDERGPNLASIPEVNDYVNRSIDNVDRVIRLINDQWCDRAGIERYKADDPSNFSEHSRNHPGWRKT